MKAILTLGLMLVSMVAAAQNQTLEIKGPAAVELAQLVNPNSQNIKCVTKIVPACPFCQGGTTVTSCSLKVESYASVPSETEPSCTNDHGLRKQALQSLKQRHYLCVQEIAALPAGPFEGEITVNYKCMSTLNGPSIVLSVQAYAIYTVTEPLCTQDLSTSEKVLATSIH
jgi:hypothetical protein